MGKTPVISRKTNEKGNMKETKKLTFAEIQALSPAERFAFMADGVKLGKKVEETRDTYKKVTPWYAKLVAALKRDHARFKDEKSIPADQTFKQFYAKNCGGELPGRLETLAAFFNSMCLVEDGKGNPLLSETYYDAASVNSLEIANKCINHAKEKQGDNWRGCDDTLDVINALSTPGDATAKLKEIRKRQNGEKEKSGDENAAVLTPEHAIEFLVAWIKTAGEKPEEKSAAIFAGTLKISDAWAESGLSDDTLNRWATNIGNEVAPHLNVVTAEMVAA